MRSRKITNSTLTSLKPVRPWLAAPIACALLLSVPVRPSQADQPTTGPSAHVPASRPTDGGGNSLPPTGGDTQDIDLFVAEIPTVVTASRHEQKITSTPCAMSVITAKDIRDAGARSVPDALRLVPGVDVAELNYGNYAVSPRGLHGLYASNTLVLVDGRAVYDTLFAGTAWGNLPFQLEDIERIEVVRGPGGVTWGANAVNGVINIITKDPATQTGLTTTGGGGSRGTNKEHVGYATQVEKLRFRVSSEYESSDGFTKPPSITGNLDDEYKSIKGAVHAIYDAGKNDKVTLSGGSAVTNGNYPVPSLLNPSTRQPSAQSNFLLSTWDHRVAEDNNIKFTGYVNDYYSAAAVRWSEYRYQQFALQASQTFKPADNHTLTWGLDSRWDLTDATTADPFMLSKEIVSSISLGAYVQDEWRFAPRWALTLGSRLDYDAYGGFEPAGRVALSYDLDDKSLVYASVARAFQMPPSAKRFEDFPLAGPLVHISTPESIDPATLIGYEMGYRGRPLDGLDFSLTSFWHDYRDLPTGEFGLGPPGLLNIGQANALNMGLYGVELDLRYQLTRKVTLLANYTFQQLDSGISSYRADFIYPPKHKFMLGARYNPRNDLHLSAHLYYVDDTWSSTASNPISLTQIRQYFRLDLRSEYEFWKDRASVAVGVRNLLDPGHMEGGTTTMDSGEVPRMVYAELRMTLK